MKIRRALEPVNDTVGEVQCERSPDAGPMAQDLQTRGFVSEQAVKGIGPLAHIPTEGAKQIHGPRWAERLPR